MKRFLAGVAAAVAGFLALAALPEKKCSCATCRYWSSTGAEREAAGRELAAQLRQ